MRGAMKSNKELDLNFIDKLQDELADMAVRARRAARGACVWRVRVARARGAWRVDTQAYACCVMRGT